MIAGPSEKSVWVRVFRPPIEGKVVHGFGVLDAGQRVRVGLIAIDAESGRDDFARVA